VKVQSKSAKSAKDERKRLAAFHKTVAAIETLGNGVATAQTLARLSEPPIARLERQGRLNVWELSAAYEIAKAFRVEIGAPMLPDPDIGIRQDLRPDLADADEARRLDTLVTYRQWRRDLAETPALAAAVALVLDERPVRATERDQGWRNGTATGHLVVALRHFAALRGNTPRGARDWRQPDRGGVLEQAVQLARLVPHRGQSASVLTRGP
jgi:hypothetical protein